MTITLTTEVFYRTESGKYWESKPSNTQTQVIDRRAYDNMASADSIRFWNGFCGGTCRAQRGYTRIGYVPVRITRINPDKTKKIVESFDFE